MGELDSYARYAENAGAQLSDQPLQMKIVRRLGVSQDDLFTFITDFERLSEWIPGARKSWSDDSKAEVPGQVGAVRMISGAVGAPVREVVKAYEAPRLLAYSATDESLRGMFTDHLSVIGCEPHSESGSVFTWLAFAKPAESAVMRFVGTKVFRFALGAGTKNLERRFPLR